MAKKISLNSAYGAIGNNWFRYYNNLAATAITTSGQLSIRWIEKALNIYLNKILETKDVDYILAADTDSCYITFDKFVGNVLKREQNLVELSPSWLRLQKRNWNLLLIRAIKLLLRLSTLTIKIC